MEVDCQKEMKDWYLSRFQSWIHDGIKAELKVPAEEDGLDKAVITFESVAFVGSVTAWGSGTVESIILNLMSGQEERIQDDCFEAEGQLQALLNEHERVFYSYLKPQGSMGLK